MSASLADRLRPVLRGAVPAGRSIDDRLEVHRELGSIPWEDALLTYVPDFIANAQGCRLTIEDDRVALGGVVESDLERERLGELTVSHLGNAFSIFENRLGIVSDRKPALATILFVAPDSLRVSGVLPTVAAKAALLKHLQAVAPAGITISDDIQIDGSLGDVEWYEKLAESTRRFFGYAMTAKIEIKGNAVMVAVDAVSDRGRSEIENAIGSLFPVSEFQVTSSMHVAESGALRAIAAEDIPVPAAPMVRVSMPAKGIGRAGDSALHKLIEETVVYFDINSAMLGTENISSLKKLGNALASAGDYQIVLRGFTDQRGDAKLNQELAQFRCRSVGKILCMHGVKEDQVVIEPWTEALMLTSPNEESWKKRRVEMRLQQPPAGQTSTSVIATADAYEMRKPLPIAPEATALASAELKESVVYFGINSFAVRRSERAKLRVVNRILSENTAKQLVIAGFCDKWGNAEYNLYLSKKRCETIKSYLEGLGVDPDRLVVNEHGGDGTDEDEESWKLRRVEFQLRDAQLGVIQ
ncbi:MAG: OmpA family protein [Verrucomicrobia bacterium]|nr:OmpA family protein [Verrucomicrobiota bacterium]